MIHEVEFVLLQLPSSVVGCHVTANTITWAHLGDDLAVKAWSYCILSERSSIKLDHSLYQTRVNLYIHKHDIYSFNLSEEYCYF